MPKHINKSPEWEYYRKNKLKYITYTYIYICDIDNRLHVYEGYYDVLIHYVFPQN